MDVRFDPPRAQDAMWMQRALEQARVAGTEGEVPVGAVVVLDGRLLTETRNRTRALTDPTGHAEVLALREAARRVGDWRLLDATIYATLEPCAMCAGSLVLARVKRLVYAAADPKAGMCGSLACIVQDPRLNHRVDMTKDVLTEESADLLRTFFRERRA